VRLADGTLAGSVVTFPDILQHIKQWTNCTLEDLVQMTSTNQATLLGLHDRGKIAVGARADLVVLDQNHRILHTFVKGERVFG
jgi:N-acetylglucosamine-6-phosphate deacetylase